MKKIKQIETSKYVILLEENKENRYVVRYKHLNMKNYSYFSFIDFNNANIAFNIALTYLEGQ